MGYACPVCDAEQADAKHLANHLAVTASLGREDHREWLADYAPDWADSSPEELGAVVAEYAREIDTPEFEDGHDHGRPPAFEDGLARQTRGAGRGALTGEADGVLEEARELTRRMHESTEDASTGDGETDSENASTGDGETDSENANENA